MHKLSALIFITLLSCNRSFAQVDITWGVPQKEARKSLLTDLLGTDDKYVYALRANYALFGNDNPVIDRYKLGDMSLDYTKPVNYVDNTGTALDQNGIFFMQGNFLVFGSHYDKLKNENVLFGEELDAGCNVIHPWKKIASIPSGKKNNAGSFYLGMSTDSTHILIVVNPPYEQYANEKFTLQLVDRDFVTTWQKQIVPPYKDEFFALDDFIVSPEGNVYMLATISKDESVMSRKERRTMPTYYHTVLMLDRETDSLREYPVKLDPKFISNVKFAVNNNRDIVCSGFYSNQGSGMIIGAFYLVIDHKTNSVIRSGTKDFSKDFLVQFMSEKKADKGHELYDYALKYLVLRDDGGAVLVAEQYQEDFVQNYDPTTHMFFTTVYYYYNDIIVVSINPDGSIAWAKKIPKYQESHNDGGYYSSFAFAVSGENMYFMFNDNPKNLTITNSDDFRTMNNPSRSVAILVTMNSNGEFARQAMFNNKDLGIILRPKLFMQLNEHRVILYGQKGRQYKLADMKMN